MTKSQFFRCIAFGLVVCCMLVLLCDLFEQENGTNTDQAFNDYRACTEGTIDAVYIGTSGVSCYWIASQAYEDYGMTVYPVTSNSLPAWLYTNVIDEVLTYQDPQLLILDIRAFTGGQEEQEIMDAQARRVLDAMKLFSPNRLSAALKSMKSIRAVYEDAPEWDISYFLSFVKYHPMWSRKDYRVSFHWGERRHLYHGYNIDYQNSVARVPITPHQYDDTIEQEPIPISRDSLYELLDYIREKDLNVLFVDTPKQMKTSTMGRTNWVYRVLEEEGFPCLTYLTTAEDGAFSIDIDYETDFFSYNHTNFYGAQKFTRAFSQYLHENYDLPDRRNDPAVQAQWDGKYQLLLDKIDEYAAAAQTQP